jgi:hypothetical protein
MALAVELVQATDWLLTTECTPPDQETSERRPYAPQGATGGKQKKKILIYMVSENGQLLVV